ncbi:MAG TPA: hypothetical protein VE242_07885 [Chthoniobacterales bacterium]|nr:hypothetical protein [Chthoniobacterales bacterium]
MSLTIDDTGIQEPLQRLFQPPAGSEKNGQSALVLVRNRRQTPSATLSPAEALNYNNSKPGAAAKLGSMSIGLRIWIAGYVFATVGLINAACSKEPLFWLAIWPAPIALISTILIFLRQGFHYRDGVLVLGRRDG